MGTWGETAFDNDAADDWIDVLLDANDAGPIVEALRAWQTKDRESDACCAALAAAEVVAAARGYPIDDLPEEVQEWLQEHSLQPNDALVYSAIHSAQEIVRESELADLWEGDESWRNAVAALVDRLAQARQSSAPASEPALPSKPAKELRQTIKILKGHGCGVEYNETKQVAQIHSFGALSGDEIPLLPDFAESLTHLRISSGDLQDEDLRPLESLPHLEFLDLSDNEELTDSCLRYLQRSTHLKDLRLNDTAISDKGMPVIAQFTGLTNLELQRCAITDAAVEHLAALPELIEVFLRGTQISENGLAQLKEANEFLGIY